MKEKKIEIATNTSSGAEKVEEIQKESPTVYREAFVFIQAKLTA